MVGNMLNPPKATYLRDYQAANREQRKALEAAAVARRLAAEAAAAQPFKLPSQGKYEHIESRVSKFLSSPSKSEFGMENEAPSGSAPGGSPTLASTRTFSKKIAAVNAPVSPPKPFIRPIVGERKAALPKFSEMGTTANVTVVSQPTMSQPHTYTPFCALPPVHHPYLID